MTVSGRIGELKKERAHDRKTRTRGLLGCGVEVRHQAIALFDEMTADSFVFGAVNPRLVVACGLGGVVAVDGLKSRELEPAGEQIRRRGASKAANVGPTHCKTAETKIDELRNGHTEVVPRRAVVAGPCGSIPLTSGVTGARKDEWPLVRPEGKKTVIGGARILHAVDIVDLEMIRGALLEPGFGDAVLDVVRHRLRGNVEDSR